MPSKFQTCGPADKTVYRARCLHTSYKNITGSAGEDTRRLKLWLYILYLLMFLEQGTDWKEILLHPQQRAASKKAINKKSVKDEFG